MRTKASEIFIDVRNDIQKFQRICSLTPNKADFRGLNFANFLASDQSAGSNKIVAFIENLKKIFKLLMHNNQKLIIKV